MWSFFRRCFGDSGETQRLVGETNNGINMKGLANKAIPCLVGAAAKLAADLTYEDETWGFYVSAMSGAAASLIASHLTNWLLANVEHDGSYENIKRELKRTSKLLTEYFGVSALVNIINHIVTEPSLPAKIVIEILDCILPSLIEAIRHEDDCAKDKQINELQQLTAPSHRIQR